MVTVMDPSLSKMNRPVFLVFFAMLFGLYAYTFNIRKNHEIAGEWRVVIVENVPPLIVQNWHLGQVLTVFPNGRVYSGQSYLNDASAPLAFFIDRSWCWRKCFEITHLNSDYRLAPSTSYQMEFQNANWIDISDRYGTRIVLNRII